MVLAGGGTAGHVSPLLATADALRRRHPDLCITVLGSRDGLEEDLVPERGYDLQLIPKVALPRRPGVTAVRFPAAFRAALRTTAEIVYSVDADVVVGFGGYVSSPVFLAARKLGIPSVVHEGNARAGLATRLGACFTPYVATTFSRTSLPHAQLLGMPLRREITTLDRVALRSVAQSEFDLTDGFPTVLVTGGSLGAVGINEPVAASLAIFRAAGVQMLHVTGRGKAFDPGPSTPGESPYVVLPYADKMQLCYAAADLVITRAGGNMVCETSTIGLPAVFVPLPIGNGEQRLNCADVVDAGGALVVDNDNFTTDYLARQVIPLVTDSDRLTAMSAAARSQGRSDADDKLTDLIERAVASVSS